jgi:hypothetical protein
MSGCSVHFESYFEEPASERDRAILKDIVSRLRSREEQRRNGEQYDNTLEARETENANQN